MGRSISEIKNNIDTNMIKLGKLIAIKRAVYIIAIIMILVSIHFFRCILITENIHLDSRIFLVLLFMVLTMIFIDISIIISYKCRDLKRSIYKDKQILKKI